MMRMVWEVRTAGMRGRGILMRRILPWAGTRNPPSPAPQASLGVMSPPVMRDGARPGLVVMAQSHPNVSGAGCMALAMKQWAMAPLGRTVKIPTPTGPQSRALTACGPPSRLPIHHPLQVFSRNFSVRLG